MNNDTWKLIIIDKLLEHMSLKLESNKFKSIQIITTIDFKLCIFSK